MPMWREDVLEAVRGIGGIGTLTAIYEAVERRRDGPLPVSWQAIVRRELEYNSSDSASHQKRHDLFRSVHGIGGGVWALREVALDKDEPTERREVTVNRIIRDTAIVRQLKALYQDVCQVCRKALSAKDGATYSEGHHVRPLGGVHRGSDTEDNILILCPNCHACCDLGFISFDETAILWKGSHRVSAANLSYHNKELTRPGVR
jgi:hypothetical protein